MVTTAFGSPEGTPCLYFHGTNSGPVEAALFDAVARDHGVRLVSVPRPSPRPSLLAWAHRAGATADELGIRRFVVAGWSAGASIALACAFALPDRVLGGVLINPAPPADEPGPDAQQRVIAACCRRAPWSIRRLLAPTLIRATGAAIAHADDARTRSRALRLFPRADREVLRSMLDDPAQRRILVAMCTASRATGPGAIASDLLAVWGRDGWGFDPGSVEVPLRAHVGDADSSAAFADRIARSGSDISVHAFAGGHHGFLDHGVRDAICGSMRELGERGR